MIRPAVLADRVARWRSPVRPQTKAWSKPAAVQWSPGEQVEDGQDQIDQAEPADEGTDDRAGADEECRTDADDAHEEADGGPDAGDLGLDPGAGKLAFELGKATEEPEGDRVDLETMAPTHEGVAQLVSQDRPEEADGSCYPADEVLDVGPSLDHGRENATGERKRDQPGDDQHRPVDAYFHAADAAESEC